MERDFRRGNFFKDANLLELKNLSLIIIYVHTNKTAVTAQFKYPFVIQQTCPMLATSELRFGRDYGITKEQYASHLIIQVANSWRAARAEVLCHCQAVDVHDAPRPLSYETAFQR